ncbi:MAG: hypothetical protein QOC81_383 [Thermoanaerobaculia bacterium]|jgi:hypothetical protein|nr:hypothetical protein [Thermoanaerobaculia bacterium]
MSTTPIPDTISFPGGYDIFDIIVAVNLAEMRHVGNVPRGETENAVMERFFDALAARHPLLGDPYELRGQELFDERRSLFNSHLKLSWFTLAYWVYGLMAVGSRLSTAENGGLDNFVTPILGALRELGVQVSEQEFLVEIDRFMPAEVTPRNVKAAAELFLSFARFLHYGALRRREVVTLDMALPGVCLAFIEEDAAEAHNISAFLTTHGISFSDQPAELTRTARLLVLLSPHAIASELFWRNLAHWKERDVVPMVVCLMPKAQLYREPPTDWRQETWLWLKDNVAVELKAETDRYVTLLRALDPQDPKLWWWNKGDAMELGLAVDVLGSGLPRPATQREASAPTGEPYPFIIDGSRVLTASLTATDRLARNETGPLDGRYIAQCEKLLERRLQPNGEPYALPWFVLIYRAWLSLAGFTYAEEEIIYAERELPAALFALGIRSDASDVAAFMKAFVNLPWAAPLSTVDTVDERIIAFAVLVHHLSQAALARTQRMRLRHPSAPSFVSYTRSDEGLARELVTYLEAKGADVWWDLNSITLGTPLKGSLSSAVSDAKYLLLIATPAAARSKYVRLEVQTAISKGLRVIPITLDGQIPAELQSLLDSAPGNVEPMIIANDSVATSVLARLERSPSEQLRSLQSGALYEELRKALREARERFGTGRIESA